MRRLALLVFLFTLFAPAAHANSNARGWCEAGATFVTTSGLTSTTQTQGSYPACTVTVLIHGGGAATIFSDNINTPLSNPFTANSNGQWIFYAADGRYDVTLTGGGLPSPVTYSDIVLVSGGTAILGLNNIFTGTNQFNSNVLIKGPNPWADITAFGARPMTTSLYPHTTVATSGCQNGSTTVTLTGTGSIGAAAFINGDGITLFGCGAATGMSTPTAPTVTPSLSIQGTNLGGGTAGGRVVNSGTGSSTYSYEIIARTKFGGYTAPSTATTITNGLSALGLGSCVVTTLTRSNDAVTVNFSAACAGAVVGAMVHLTGQSNADFVGWFNVAVVNSSTQIVLNTTSLDTRGFWQSTDSSTATGGIADFYLSNHLNWPIVTGAWEYYICAERPGDVTFKLIGQTRPSANTYYDVMFDDYGSPYMDLQTYPLYITNALCNGGTATSDPLTTTIVSGAGTTSLVVANAASTTSTGGIATFDDAPAILNAANSIAQSIANNPVGTLFIPPSYSSTLATGGVFIVASYLKLPASIGVYQVGALGLFETLELPGNVTWNGGYSSNGLSSFGSTTSALIQDVYSNPMIYVSQPAVVFNYVTLNNNRQNGGTGIVRDNAGAFTMIGSQLTMGGVNNTDYLSTAYVNRTVSGGGGVNEDHFYNTNFNSGPNQILDKSWTPLIFYAVSQNGSGGLFGNQQSNLECRFCNFSRRGIEQAMAGGSGGEFDFVWVHRQGGITPFLLLGNTVGNIAPYVRLEDVILDTEAVSTVASVGGGTGPTEQPQIDAVLLQDGSGDSGSQQTPPPFTGWRPQSVRVSQSSIGKLPNVNGYGTPDLLQTQIFGMFEPQAMIGPSAYLYWPIAPPTNVVGTLAAGGSLTNHTWQAQVTAVGPDGNESAPSALSNAVTTSGGNNTINYTWNAVAGAVSYNFYQCGNVATCSITGNLAGTRQVTTGITTASYSYTSEASGVNPPTKGTTGVSTVNSAGAFAPKFECAEGSAPTGLAGADITYCDSTAHRWKMINNNGTADVVVGAATADTLTNKTGITSTGTVDFTGATVSKLRVGAGCATAANGDFCYDTTGANWHTFDNGVDSYLMTAPVSGSFTTGDAAQVVVATNAISLKDFGSGTPKIEYCGATSGATQNCAKTVEAAPIIIFGDVTLNTATTQSITTLPFTSASSYSCSGSDLTTVTGIVSFNTYAAASVTIAESGGVNTDHLRYVCAGF